VRVGITTWGTEGDLRPFMALAHTLVARGHTVQLDYTSVEGRDLGPLAASAGVVARSVAKEYFASRRDQIQREMASVFASTSPLAQIRGIVESTLDPVTDVMFDAADELAQTSDVMVGHFMTHPAGAAAQKHRKPYVLVALAPVLPSALYPPIGTPNLGRLANPLLWWILGRVLESILEERVNATRVRAGLPTVKNLLASTLDQVTSVLVAVSPTLFPRPADWDPRIALSGFLRMPDSVEPWEPDAALRAFLEKGDPPVFLSFGSMLSLGDQRTLEAVGAMRGALAKAGMRGVIQAPADVVAAQTKDDTVCFIDRAPHAQLFPRCSVIVHHGGAGTTQSALLSGRPSVVVPHVADQFFWGERLMKQGVGVKPLPRVKLTAGRLAERLREAVGDCAMREKALAAGAALSGEDGATRAAELIEQVS
jgi:sterol 3beta-glucosyltransferase